MTLKAHIKSTAKDVGFSLCGVTSANPIAQFNELTHAIAENRTAKMNYLTRNPEGRCNPVTLLSNAKSVICCAYRVRLSRHSDYHIIVREKLGLLWNTIQKEHPDARCKICVDTSPLLEKALAERAGLGWIGKNTVLINDKLGSFFVLGEIITDIEIEPDTPAENLCGDCHSCLDSCPTKALIAPRTLNASRCISYFTIEKKETAPDDIVKLIDPYTYGCDICQEACLYNTAVYNTHTV